MPDTDMTARSAIWAALDAFASMPPPAIDPDNAPLLDALEPRTCACGEPTGSTVLDTCEGCERAHAAVAQFHALATEAHGEAYAV